MSGLRSSLLSRQMCVVVYTFVSLCLKIAKTEDGVTVHDLKCFLLLTIIVGVCVHKFTLQQYPPATVRGTHRTTIQSNLAPTASTWGDATVILHSPSLLPKQPPMTATDSLQKRVRERPLLEAGISEASRARKP